MTEPIRTGISRILANTRLILIVAALSGSSLLAQSSTPWFRAKDPGPRPNPPSVIPKPLPGLNANEIALFNESLLRMSELEGTCDTCVQQPQNVLPIDPDPSNPLSPSGLVNSAGMGPVFNADQCFSCHSQPVIGGTSPAKNPAHLIAHRLGGTNTVPEFERADGPLLEVRFKFNRDGSRDGGVHSLFTAQGRSDAPDCRLEQPDFEREVQRRNIAFRAPLQLLGLGLIEAIQDSAIRENMHRDRETKERLGIHGHTNVVPNNGTISRFGWKAQNASLTLFAGEAYNVEMGISNDLFPISRDETPGCNLAYEAFDIPRTDSSRNADPLKIMPAWLMFTEFMRFVEPPAPAPLSKTALRGRELFSQVGCALCHTPAFRTPGVLNPTRPAEEIGPSTVAMRGREVALYSDLLVHRMGAALADNIVQGNAGPDEFRTTPLWGLGQRLFFLHDGRTNDLMTAIQDHFSVQGSDGGDNPERDRESFNYGPSEANDVIRRFNALKDEDKQSLLDFLRAL